MKITYRLCKDDYMDFVRYEASYRDNPTGRKKFFIAAICVCLFVCVMEYVIGSIVKFNDTVRIVQISAGMSAATLLGLCGMMSEKNRMKSLWIKYGFNRVEKANMYPKITVDFREDCLIFSSDKSSDIQNYRYDDIEELVTLQHIVMMRMKGNVWQFVSKKGFVDWGGAADFVNFLTEKNADIVVSGD